jgi:hypothetical protein
LKDSCLVLTLLIILIIAAGIALFSRNKTSGTPNDTVQSHNTQAQETLIETLIQQGYAIINCDRCQVFIDSIIWSESDAAGKKSMAVAFAKYVKEKKHNNNSTYFIDIYEKHSGKKLANWKSSTGYKEFEQ